MADVICLPGQIHNVLNYTNLGAINGVVFTMLGKAKQLYRSA